MFLCLGTKGGDTWIGNSGGFGGGEAGKSDQWHSQPLDDIDRTINVFSLSAQAVVEEAEEDLKVHSPQVTMRLMSSKENKYE